MTEVTAKNALQELFYDLEFESQRHLYFIPRDGKKVRLPSVSSKVEEYVPPFDEAFWLPICAKKEKTTEHELRLKWQRTNTTAKVLGHNTHDFLEHFTGFETPRTPQEKAGISFLKSIDTKRYVILFKELRMYHKVLRYAGTTDLVLWDKQEKCLVIVDYKTNADLFKTFRYMLGAFSMLENHPFNHYQVQLSFYQILLEQSMFKVGKRQIVHLKADETFEVLDCHDLTDMLMVEFKQQQRLVA